MADEAFSPASLRPIPVLEAVTRERFESDILPANQPVVMRGLVGDWPLVQAARTSPQAAAAHLQRFDSGAPRQVMVAPPENGGSFFYRSDMKGFNFMRDQAPISQVVAWQLANGAQPDRPSVYLPSMVVKDVLPGLEREMSMPLLDGIEPRIWIGTKLWAQTHFDPSHNIACVLAGRRRFTLFPPDQVENLYVAPFDNGPGGVAFSMAPLEAPDFERYPRFREALAHAVSGELEPGDAVFIPYMWWHHVRSLASFNILLNYWWDEGREGQASPYAGFYAALLSLRDLPREHRLIWRRLLDLLVFDDPEGAVAHLPVDARGVFGPMKPEMERQLKAFIKTHFKL